MHVSSSLILNHLPFKNQAQYPHFFWTLKKYGSSIPLDPLLTLSTNEESEIKHNDQAYFRYWPCIFVEKLRKTTPFPCPFSENTLPQTFCVTCLMTLNKTWADYTVKGMAPNKNAHWMQCSDFHLSTINSLNRIFNNFNWTLSGCFIFHLLKKVLRPKQINTDGTQIQCPNKVRVSVHYPLKQYFNIS